MQGDRQLRTQNAAAITHRNPETADDPGVATAEQLLSRRVPPNRRKRKKKYRGKTHVLFHRGLLVW